MDAKSMPPEIEIVMPSGAMGAAEDYLLAAILRAIGDHHGTSSKYGANIETQVFMMHRFCWCDSEDCAWCWDESEKGERAPNFHHKPSGLKVNWYKYIGRDIVVNKQLSIPELAKVLADCVIEKT